MNGRNPAGGAKERQERIMRRNKILIIDDEELNRELLRQIFEGQYKIVMAKDGKEGLAQFQQYSDSLAAVLLDLNMPVMDGYEVLDHLHKIGSTNTVPVIVITADSGDQTALRCYSIGASEIITKPFVMGIVNRRVRNMIEMYSSRERLQRRLNTSEEKLAERGRQLEEFNDKFVDTISDVVEFRDGESGQHIKRVKGLTWILGIAYAKLYPEAGLTEERIRMIEKAAALHDIGKIAIPDAILLKPGRLTDEERRIMQTHTTKGCDILLKLENVQDQEHYAVAYEIVRHHHERYDGKGYPDGLKGDEIPLSAQLVSVADVYDALSSPRVYKAAYDKEKTYRMILNGECGIFDPKLMKSLAAARSTMETFVDSTSGKEL